MQLYVQLACAGLLKCYHNMSVFNWVKLAYAFTHFPPYPHFIHNPTNQPFKLSTALLTALLITPLFLHLSPCYYLYTLHHTMTHYHLERLKQHTQQHNTHKQYNNITTHKRTCYSHRYSPTTLQNYETMNRLSENLSHFIDTIIKTIQYNRLKSNNTATAGQ